MNLFERISINQAEELINSQEALVVDVRDPNSFSQGHIEDAVRIDNANVQAFIDSADKSKPLVVVCYHGNSSQQAAAVLAQQGFEKSYSMDGGMSDWVLTKPVVSGE